MSNQIYIYLTFSAFLVACGIFGVIKQKSLFGMLLSAKLIFLAAALNFVIFHKFIFKGKSDGEVYALTIIAVSISSIVVISSFILAYYRENRSINTDDLS